jgi:hypothetical protein
MLIRVNQPYQTRPPEDNDDDFPAVFLCIPTVGTLLTGMAILAAVEASHRCTRAGHGAARISRRTWLSR